MALFRRKPIEVEAVQYQSDLPEAQQPVGLVRTEGSEDVAHLEVGGTYVMVRPGDWVITPKHGPSYVLPDRIFHEYYVPVPDQHHPPEPNEQGVEVWP